jgi:hypothetical protein
MQNVITQGKIHVFSTSFESQFFESNSTITCQGDTITAGNQLFTNDPTRVPGSAAAQGNFSWQLLSVYVPGVNGGVSNGFGYRGERISKVSVSCHPFDRCYWLIDLAYRRSRKWILPYHSIGGLSTMPYAQMR